MVFKRGYYLYDVITKQEIFIPVGSVMTVAKSLGIDYTALSKLSPTKTILNRYILSEAKDLVFTLVDIETGKEYECVTNKSIFIHLGLPYSDNDAKYVYELRKKRQGRASICGRLFSLKGGYESKLTSNVKVLPSHLKQTLDQKKLSSKIKGNIYSRVRRAITSYGGYKSERTSELVGCSEDSLIKYIELKFTKNMGWHNRNLWQIDHIIPCAKFDLTKEEDRRKCFHYTNIQPIWSTTEIAKRMGEVEYDGNQNKNDNGFEYDYHVAEIFLKNSKVPLTQLQAKEIAIELFRKGVKRVLPEHFHLYD